MLTASGLSPPAHSDYFQLLVLGCLSFHTVRNNYLPVHTYVCKRSFTSLSLAVRRFRTIPLFFTSIRAMTNLCKLSPRSLYSIHLDMKITQIRRESFRAWASSFLFYYRKCIIDLTNLLNWYRLLIFNFPRFLLLFRRILHVVNLDNKFVKV